MERNNCEGDINFVKSPGAFFIRLNKVNFVENISALITILDNENLQLTISRLAHQLVETLHSPEDVVFIGIQPRGVQFSKKIVEAVQSIFPGQAVSYGILDITFYRDDIRDALHKANRTDISFSIEGKKVILIDDVLYTGRTIRAALDALLDFGRPCKVELCVLVDRRFNRELPIQPDYCGISIDTIVSQKVKIDWETEKVILYS